MPTTCIVPNCTSRYSNFDKVSFFLVPKDKELCQLWGERIKRNDLKAHHRICEKHFSTSDILWDKKFFSPDGKLLAVAKYRKPMLKENALPRLDVTVSEADQQNSNSPSPVDTLAPMESVEIKPDVSTYFQEKYRKPMLSEKALPRLDLTISETDQKNSYSPSPVDTSAPVESVETKPDVSTYFQEKYIKPMLREKALPRLDLTISEKDKKNSYSPSPVDTLAPVKSVDTNLHDVQDDISNDDANVSSSDIENSKNRIFSFSQILNYSLPLPSNWTKINYNYEKMSIVVFSKTVFQNIHGSLGTIAQKEVIINQNLELHINVYHLPVQTHLLQIDKFVKSETELKDILCLIESLNVCRGCSVSPELEKLKSEVTFLDCTNTLRHKDCHLLIKSIQCRCCWQGKRTLARKRSRQENQLEVKRICAELPTSIKNYIETKNRKLKNTKKENKRLRVANMTLKERLKTANVVLKERLKTVKMTLKKRLKAEANMTLKCDDRSPLHAASSLCYMKSRNVKKS